ncbi:MAG: type II secretion system inner membrane protein GspF [Xanthomonadales bacterium]|nr:type II secretion system inner membrane protein GspF [Xanthomonadales bacterium]
MSAYSWQALDQQGKTQKGIAQADSARQLRQQLRDKGLTPLDVATVVDGDRKIKGRRLSLPANELVLILRQLATLTQASLPLEEALATVAEQSERPASRELLAAIRSSVLEGRSMATAMSDFPRQFPNWLVSSVDAGERSGQLDAVLERLADHAEQRLSITRRLGMTLIYPVVVTVVAIIVVVAMMILVVPKVTAVFVQSGDELPLLTRMLMGVSESLNSYGIYILLALVGLGFLLHRAWNTPAARQRIQGVFLRLPLLGRFIRSVNTSRFTRTLSLLVSSAVPLAEALPVAVRSMPNDALRKQLAGITRSVVEGSPLGRAMRNSEAFPPLVLRLVDVGESSGQLANMLSRAADTQEENLTALSETLVGLLQPALILLVGGFVLMIVLAVMLPILSFNQLIA